MTFSIPCRIMDALAGLLQGAAAAGQSDIPGVDALFLDPARVASFPDGVVLTLDQSGQAGDEIATTCRLSSTLPVVVSVIRSRVPNDPPNWQLLDPFYVAIHARIMGNRKLGGLSNDIKPAGRAHESDPRACMLQCFYTVEYQTDQVDVTTV